MFKWIANNGWRYHRAKFVIVHRLIHLEGLYFDTCANLAMWRFYWHKGDSDWSTLAVLMRFQLLRMRKSHITSTIKHVGYEKDIRRMTICINALDRLEKDDYIDMIYQTEKTFGFQIESKRWSDMAKQDDEIVFTILKKHLRGWWI